jgi:hypothetical protein
MRRKEQEMADRVAREVWGKPKRRAGLGVGLAACLAAVSLLTGWLSTGAPAARTIRAASLAAQQQAIDSKVGSLISRMTVAEKFGQLEMSGPTTPLPRSRMRRDRGKLDRSSI